MVRKKKEMNAMNASAQSIASCYNEHDSGRRSRTNFLNSGTEYKLFKKTALFETYVNKTMMIDTLYHYVNSAGKYLCVTRPRRFGKSMAANMIAAFFDKNTKEESRTLFENCKVGLLKTEQEKIWSVDSKGAEARKLCWPV